MILPKNLIVYINFSKSIYTYTMNKNVRCYTTHNLYRRAIRRKANLEEPDEEKPISPKKAKNVPILWLFSGETGFSSYRATNIRRFKSQKLWIFSTKNAIYKLSFIPLKINILWPQLPMLLEKKKKKRTQQNHTRRLYHHRTHHIGRITPARMALRRDNVEGLIGQSGRRRHSRRWLRLVAALRVRWQSLPGAHEPRGRRRRRSIRGGGAAAAVRSRLAAVCKRYGWFEFEEEFFQWMVRV